MFLAVFIVTSPLRSLVRLFASDLRLEPTDAGGALGLVGLSAKALHLRRPVGIFLTHRRNSRSYSASHQWVRAGHAGHILECAQKRVNEDQLFTRRHC